jgi:hypothetical protein
MSNQSAWDPSDLTWRHVWERMDYLMELHEWAVSVELSRPPGGRYGPTRGLWVRCVARRRVGEAGLYAERATGRLWPDRAFRSVPAMLWTLLDELDRALADTAIDALTGMPLGSYTCPPKTGPK